ncbi:helix-turn-helix domain-containing protein [Microbacterium sp. P06]|uniref:helix-turn-helix domain-containing protein n=1 Tax=Microbacterium sp. P06 TaxID=3366949 RepID=UPI003746B0F6
MAAGQRTAPEVEAQVIELVKAGKTRREVSEATGVSARVITRIVRDAPGVEFAMNGTGSNGTPEAMAKARGVQSEYARNRRAALSDRILDATERTLDLLASSSLPRERQYLSQALRNHTAAYADLTVNDAKAAPDLTVVLSIFDRFNANAETLVSSVFAPPRPGLIQD